MRISIFTRRPMEFPGARTLTLLAAFVWLVGPASIARGDDTNLKTAMANDVLLRALVDELGRGLDGLQLEDLKRPFFIEYGAQDAVVVGISATLGAVVSQSEQNMRRLRVDSRVGSYELDNTNFVGGAYSGLARALLPAEDDYEAVRQAIWWATDRSYKSAAEAFPRKLALMEGKIIEDKPDDFSKEQPTVHLDAKSDRRLPMDELEKLAVELSGIFRDYPDVQQSGVRIRAGAGNDYLVNTEGTRLRTKGAMCEISIYAMVQADDGMTISDSMSVYLDEPIKVPSSGELATKVREMTERLLKIRVAPKLESTYSGPVLVEAGASGSIFGSSFVRRFAGGQRPVGSRSRGDDFEKKLGKRILPRSVNVVDDPTIKKSNGELVLGDYEYDDQGVPSKPLTLVEEGRLKALVMSRNPSKEFKQSTGHGRGSLRPRASISNLVITSSDPMDEKAMREEFIEAFVDEDNEFGIRIASLRRGVPVEVYKVFPDGREEMVRGVNAVRADARAFKRMLAVGDTPAVLNVLTSEAGQSITAPAMLFEELDLSPVDSDFDKPPFIDSPLARVKAQQKSGA